MKNLRYFIVAIGFALFATNSYADVYDPAKKSFEQKKREECVRLANADPQKAIDMAIDWRTRFGAYDAEYCLGIAYINNDNFEVGASKLVQVAPFYKEKTPKFAMTIYSQAANGFLLAGLFENALSSINQALDLEPQNGDILIDRARIYAELEKWADSEQDLTKAMELRGPLGFGLRLRAEAKLQQVKYDAALEDIEKAILLEPKEVDNYLIRGRIREAKRLSLKGK